MHRVKQTNGAVTLLEVTFVPETSVTWRLHASLPAAAQSWQCRIRLEISFERQNLNWESKQHNIFNAEMTVLCKFCWLWFFSFLLLLNCCNNLALIWNFFMGKEDHWTQLTSASVRCTFLFLHTENSCFVCYANTLHIIPGIPTTFITHCCFQTHDHTAPKHKLPTR